MNSRPFTGGQVNGRVRQNRRPLKIRAKISILSLLLLITTVAMFFALRGWWIRAQDPSNTLLVPIILATFVSVVSSSLGERPFHIANVTAFTAFLATSAVSIETICLSKATAFMRSHRIIARYNTDIQLNVFAILVVTTMCFVGGGILGLSISKIRKVLRHRWLAGSNRSSDN